MLQSQVYLHKHRSVFRFPAMAEYVGLIAIAKRMGYKSAPSVALLQARDAFPMLKKFVRGKLRWWIDDELIYRWYLTRAAQDRATIIKHGMYGTKRVRKKGAPWKRDFDGRRRECKEIIAQETAQATSALTSELQAEVVAADGVDEGNTVQPAPNSPPAHTTRAA